MEAMSHWSRDCPSSSSAAAAANPNPNSSFKSSDGLSSLGPSKPVGKSSEKPKKLPRTRPKLTPGLLLSDDGLGFILRYFPRAFKFRGRGHEVSDLGNLIRLYGEWHSRLLPYYPFEQFVDKVEQVGTTKHVRVKELVGFNLTYLKTCIRELRERVANGGDPTKLHEPPVEPACPNEEQAGAEAMDLEKSHFDHESMPNMSHHTDDIQEGLIHELYEKATTEPFETLHGNTGPADALCHGCTSTEGPQSQAARNGSSTYDAATQITEEQRARMEANRLKALARAAARAGASQAPV
ncbi:Chromosome segregation in meiosis protein 3 [Dillenia turbinata]|uniref:Chromosome segregation in meiosis protein 3 n=1 Tax=Dillenia turbinata TaxID=194707 RepID=A0AAN8VBA9_9MAGN